MKIVLNVFFVLFLASCSNIQVINQGVRSDLYTADFIDRINKIKDLYRNGQQDAALRRLKLFDDTKILPVERALKENLIGVIYFASGDYEKAIFNFDIALNTSRIDEMLTAQIYLNLSSAYYKMDLYEKSEFTIKQIDPKYLQKNELQKYYHLEYMLANRSKDDSRALLSLVHYLGQKESLSEVKSSPLLEKVLREFSSLGHSEKIRFLEEYQEEKYSVVGLLAVNYAEKLYYGGEKDRATDLIGWIEGEYAHDNEITQMVEGFNFRLGHVDKVNPHAIGIVLPFGGKGHNDARFASRALDGIDFAYRNFQKTNEGVKPQLYYEDSKGNQVIGSHSVKELVEKHQVSIIIGGLLPTEATSEYLEARKYGAFFISLYPIHLPREKKSTLLLEVPGSLESQMSMLFSEKTLTEFGKRVALLYPQTEYGSNLAHDFWSQAKIKGVEVTKVQSYEKNNADFTDPVKTLLRLKYTRERQEEYDILSRVHKLEKRRGGPRRIQTLGPDIDFDWVYLPMSPRETLQAIPAFSYYDAYKLKFVGGPSWRSRELSKRGKRLGTLYFVGDSVDNVSEDFKSKFYTNYLRNPRLIEMMSYDAMNIALKLLDKSDFTSRGELESFLRNREMLSGLTGSWKLEDSLWIKDMTLLSLKRGKIDNVFEEVGEAEVEKPAE